MVSDPVDVSKMPLAPEYPDTFNRYFAGKSGYFCSMFVARKEISFRCCEWPFPLLDQTSEDTFYDLVFLLAERRRAYPLDQGLTLARENIAPDYRIRREKGFFGRRQFRISVCRYFSISVLSLIMKLPTLCGRAESF